MTTNVKPINKCEKCGCEILDGDRLCIHCYKKKVIITSIIFSTLWISTAFITALIFDVAVTFGIWWFWFILFPYVIKKSKYITKRKMYYSIPVTLEELAPKLRHNPEVLSKFRKKYKLDDDSEFNAKYFALYVQDHIYKDLNRCKSNVLAEHPGYLSFVRDNVNDSANSAADIFYKNVKKFLAVCNEVSNEEKVSLLFSLASIIVVTPLDENFNLPALKNKYVLADISLLLTLYATAKISDMGYYISDEDEEKLYSYISTGITSMYGLNVFDLTSIKENRIPYFEEYLYKVYPDIDSYINEAILLLDYDVTYNKYVEFKDNSPVIVHNDFVKQMTFENQIKDFLKGMMEIIDKHLSGAYI